MSSPHTLTSEEIQKLRACALKARENAYCEHLSPINPTPHVPTHATTPSLLPPSPITIPLTSPGPYSHFRVGASLLTSTGTYIPGSNVENAAYPSGTCAERVALGYAVGGLGLRRGDFKAVAVITDLGRKEGGPASPCGMCRQVMREFLEEGCQVVLFCAGEGKGEGEEGEEGKEGGKGKGKGEWKAEEEKEGEAGFVVMTMGELLPMSFGPDTLPTPSVMDRIQKGG